MCDAINHEEVYKKLIERCIEIFEKKETVNVTEIAVALMDLEEVPMHYPFHHFIVPAALLIATALKKDDSSEQVEKLLDIALERSQEVPGGSCGYMGNCGAAVGAGIYMSVYTDTSPMSTKTWSWCNELTGRCLQALAQIQGPRCCKRSCIIVIQEAVPFINEKLELELEFDRNFRCKYYKNNNDCKRHNCPFYPIEK